MKNKDGKKSIQSSLFFVLSLIAIIPIGISICICIIISSMYIKSSDYTLGNEIISRTVEELDFYFEQIITTQNFIANNYDLQLALRRKNFRNEGDRRKLEIEINSSLFGTTFADKDTISISVIGENGCNFKSNTQAFLDQDNTAQDWYKQINESKNYVWFKPHVGKFANVSDGRNYITCGRNIYDKSTGEILGVIIVDIDEKIIRDKLQFNDNTKGYLFIVEDNEVIVSTKGYIGSLIGIDELINAGSDLKNTKLKSIGDAQNVVVSDGFTVIEKMRITDWSVIGFISSNSLSSWWKTLVGIDLILAAALIIATVFFARKMTKMIAAPLKNIQKTMRRVEEGDMKARITSDMKYEETEELACQFNKMLSKTRDLLEETYTKQRKLRKAEMTILQAQINPHFLYNTLDAVLWLNRMGRTDDVEKMISALSTFFRIGVSKGEEIISLKEEVQHFESYIQIQEIRFREQLKLLVDIDETVMECKIPKLTLQPLTENAIYHGIEPNDQYGTIKLSIKKKSDMIEICLSDDGAGMTQETVDRLNQSIVNSDSTERKLGYGVLNVHSRLEQAFDCKIKMFYESEVEEGTCVYIMIPALKK